MVAIERLLARELTEARCYYHVVPKGEQLSALPSSGEPGVDGGDLSTFARSVDSREANYFQRTPVRRKFLLPGKARNLMRSRRLARRGFRQRHHRANSHTRANDRSHSQNDGARTPLLCGRDRHACRLRCRNTARIGRLCCCRAHGLLPRRLRLRGCRLRGLSRHTWTPAPTLLLSGCFRLRSYCTRTVWKLAESRRLFHPRQQRHS